MVAYNFFGNLQFFEVFKVAVLKPCKSHKLLGPLAMCIYAISEYYNQVHKIKCKGL